MLSAVDQRWWMHSVPSSWGFITSNENINEYIQYARVCIIGKCFKIKAKMIELPPIKCNILQVEFQFVMQTCLCIRRTWRVFTLSLTFHLLECWFRNRSINNYCIKSINALCNACPYSHTYHTVRVQASVHALHNADILKPVTTLVLLKSISRFDSRQEKIKPASVRANSANETWLILQRCPFYRLLQVQYSEYHSICLRHWWRSTILKPLFQATMCTLSRLLA